MDKSHLTERQIRVIIPVYNCKSYLQQAVESVISQPYQAISVILVDDGSTDGSSLLCDELAARDDRITVFHQKHYIPFLHARARTLIKKSPHRINFPFRAPTLSRITLTLSRSLR